MHKNPFWLSFLALFTIILLWYSGDALWKLWGYKSLTTVTRPVSIHFSVVEEPIEKYFLKGSYTIEVKGNLYEGETLLRDPLFRNSLAAEEAVQKFDAKEWRVWYSETNPKYSSLQKRYPFKECLYACLLWALFAYFLWLGWRVTNEHSHS